MLDRSSLPQGELTGYMKFPIFNYLSEYIMFNYREAERALGRLSRMIRGLGDPLIAAYARMFLCRMGVSVAPSLNHYIAESLQDFLHALKQVLTL